MLVRGTGSRWDRNGAGPARRSVIDGFWGGSQSRGLDVWNLFGSTRRQQPCQILSPCCQQQQDSGKRGPRPWIRDNPDDRKAKVSVEDAGVEGILVADADPAPLATTTPSLPGQDDKAVM